MGGGETPPNHHSPPQTSTPLPKQPPPLYPPPGPFSPQEMGEWFQAGYFPMTLLVKRGCDEVFQPLGDVIKMWGRVPFVPGPSPPPLLVRSPPNLHTPPDPPKSVLRVRNPTVIHRLGGGALAAAREPLNTPQTPPNNPWAPPSPSPPPRRTPDPPPTPFKHHRDPLKHSLGALTDPPKLPPTPHNSPWDPPQTPPVTSDPPQGNLDQERLKKQQELAAAAALYQQLQQQQFLQLLGRWVLCDPPDPLPPTPGSLINTPPPKNVPRQPPSPCPVPPKSGELTPQQLGALLQELQALKPR